MQTHYQVPASAETLFGKQQLNKETRPKTAHKSFPSQGIADKSLQIILQMFSAVPRPLSELYCHLARVSLYLTRDETLERGGI